MTKKAARIKQQAEARLAGIVNLDGLSKSQFLEKWFAVFYLYPGLHPDGWSELGSGWPRRLRPLAKEAERRAMAGELTDGEHYPSRSQRQGLADQMKRA